MQSRRLAGIVVLALLLPAIPAAVLGGQGPAAPASGQGGASPGALPNSVFAMFSYAQANERRMAAIQAAFQQKRYAELEGELRELALADQVPGAAGGHCYNLACAQARLGKNDLALKSLELAIASGFVDYAHMQADADLESLRDLPAFGALVARAKKAAGERKVLSFRQGALTFSVDPAMSLRAEPFAAGPVAEGVARVTEADSLWVARPGMILVVHRFDPADPRRDAPIVEGEGAAGALLAGWQKDGTAAGLLGVIYDNHDRGHSRLNTEKFPQMARLVYDEPARKLNLDNGLQCFFIHTAERTEGWQRGCIVLSNTSEAEVNGPFWRSLPRRALLSPFALQIAVAHYFANHITFYPEHRDHDPGRNGQGGYGDVYPCNTPYFVISQGSSGSDQAFVRAAACTIAAFRPETRLALEEQGLVAPTVQMILRMSGKALAASEEYLTGKAHPTVFDGGRLDVEKMVRLAHDMKADEIPGLALLAVREETQARPGTDYISPLQERLFDTPCAIARVARSLAFERRMVVSAEASRDPHGRPLTFHWAVLRGDPDAVRIRPLNENASAAEIVVAYQSRRPVLPGSPLESNRVDIGVFTHNGAYYSAPSFVSVLYLDSETRVYDGKRIQSVEYKSQARGGNYADPLIAYMKDWKDEYHYDEQGRLLGWTRTMPDGKKTEITRDGLAVVSRDDKGRVREAAVVRYAAQQAGPAKAPTLEPVVGAEKFVYEYASDDDPFGKPRPAQ